MQNKKFFPMLKVHVAPTLRWRFHNGIRLMLASVMGLTLDRGVRWRRQCRTSATFLWWTEPSRSPRRWWWAHRAGCPCGRRGMRPTISRSASWLPSVRVVCKLSWCSTRRRRPSCLCLSLPHSRYCCTFSFGCIVASGLSQHHHTWSKESC